jgi:hypothetical protein
MNKEFRTRIMNKEFRTRNNEVFLIIQNTGMF